MDSRQAAVVDIGIVLGYTALAADHKALADNAAAVVAAAAEYIRLDHKALGRNLLAALVENRLAAAVLADTNKDSGHPALFDQVDYIAAG